jgi:FixJ family two-component response regulator
MAEIPPWIAVVDDDPAVLKGLRRLLQSRAFRVQTFESGRDFLAALPHGLPECLIVDLQMPGMSGLELQQHLARNGIPIATIMIYAHGEAALRGRHEEAGLVAFLLKPVQENSLFAAINKAIGASPGSG